MRSTSAEGSAGAAGSATRHTGNSGKAAAAVARSAAGSAPVSAGAQEQAELQAGVNAQHRGDPRADTGDFGDKNGPGNLRLDYVLPAKETTVVGGGVYWPPGPGPKMVGLLPPPGSLAPPPDPSGTS